jgi:hypothetical protein
MHEAVKIYLGGRLSLAPLEESTSTMSILDMGSVPKIIKWRLKITG